MASFWIVLKYFLAKYVCPNQLDDVFSVAVLDTLATAIEPRRSANNKRRHKILNSQNLTAHWGLLLLIIVVVCPCWRFEF